jgi:AcrR family transcriptional regulator
MAEEPGLRERKKQQTRQLITETARNLFVQRGFEHVTVAEVARAAEVSAATVFNYFPTKEDLVYSGLERFETALLDAIRDRRPGESVLTAFGQFVLEPRGLLATTDPEAAERFAAIVRMITASPALLARERQIFDRHTRALAELLAAETRAHPNSIEPWVVANTLLGVHEALLGYTRHQILSGRRNPSLARAVRTQAHRALNTLSTGLADYAIS